jgi:hypothetical protein
MHFSPLVLYAQLLVLSLQIPQREATIAIMETWVLHQEMTHVALYDIQEYKIW